MRREAGPGRPHLAAPPFSESVVIELPGSGYWVTFSPDGRYGFVALSDRDEVAVADTASKRVVRYLDAGKAPRRNLILEYAQSSP